MLNASAPVFLSKIICVATSHSSGVMVNSAFPVMDEAIHVWAMTEFVHQVYVKLIGARKHSCALKLLSILNMGPITTFLPTSLSTFLKWKVKKKNIRRIEWNCEEKVFPIYVKPPFIYSHTSWCDQLNDSVNKLTRIKPFLWQNFFCGNVGLCHRSHLF